MSHLNYGSHQDFHQDFNLATMLREPFKRALSNYTYSCMRKQQKPSIDGFKAYFREPEQINMMNKQLTPDPLQINAQNTFKNLSENFH